MERMEPSFDECFLEKHGIRWEEAVNSVPLEVRKHLVKLAADYLDELWGGICECESPIEQLFGAYVYEYARSRSVGDDGEFILNVQQDIETPTGKFRVDFLLAAYINGKPVSLIVECDGHDFHEKTKAQAAKDKRRDRALKFAGNEIIHFTGSEIWKDPWKCAREAVEYMRQLAK
jgi:very-short-patch-repair endonuclease